MPFQSAAGLGHLHQGHTPLLHPCAAGAGKNNHRKPLGRSPLYHPRNLLTNHMAHAAHQKPGVTDTKSRLLPVNQTSPRDNGLIQPGLLPGLPHLILISRKIQRIAELHSTVPLLKTPFIRCNLNPSESVNTEIRLTFRTRVQTVHHIIPINRLTALSALSP